MSNPKCVHLPEFKMLLQKKSHKIKKMFLNIFFISPPYCTVHLPCWNKKNYLFTDYKKHLGSRMYHHHQVILLGKGEQLAVDRVMALAQPREIESDHVCGTAVSPSWYRGRNQEQPHLFISFYNWRAEAELNMSG